MSWHGRKSRSPDHHGSIRRGFPIPTNSAPHILIAPDSFKGTLAAEAVAEAMAEGVAAALPEATCDRCPIADGGEGTAGTLVTATGGELRAARVTGPLGEAVAARWGLLGEQAGQPRTAVVEMAAASGLPLVEESRRDPLRTTTYGTGELIGAALEAGGRRIILAIGGSATNDGGLGAAQALGARFFDDDGRAMTEPLAGGALRRIGRIDLSGLDARLGEVELRVACDVRNPLTGEHGASAVFGPQKGADAAGVRELEGGLAHVADLVARLRGRDFRDEPGAGAAGGLGFGAMALLGGRLERGAALVLEAVDFASRVSRAALCMTGEGQADAQTASGKAMQAVAEAAGVAKVPAVGYVGARAADCPEAKALGLAALHSLAERFGRDRAMSEPAACLRQLVGETVGEHV